MLIGARNQHCLDQQKVGGVNQTNLQKARGTSREIHKASLERVFSLGVRNASRVLETEISDIQDLHLTGNLGVLVETKTQKL